jgi:hypothetical protein
MGGLYVAFTQNSSARAEQRNGVTAFERFEGFARHVTNLPNPRTPRTWSGFAADGGRGAFECALGGLNHLLGCQPHQTPKVTRLADALITGTAGEAVNLRSLGRHYDTLANGRERTGGVGP